MVREFKLPDVGEGLTEAEIVNWLVEVGDTVKEDQPVAEVETDKAVVEVPAPVNGTVREILAEEGEMVSVGTVIITFDVEGEAEEPVEEPAEDAAADASNTSDSEEEGTVLPDDAGSDGEPEGTATKGGRTFAAPSARQLARELDVEIADVDGTGASGRVTEQDVRAHAESAGERDDGKETEPTMNSATLKGTDDEAEPAAVPSSVEDAGRNQTLAAPATRKLADDEGVDIDDVPSDEMRDGETFVTAEQVREYAEAKQAPQEADTGSVQAGADERKPADFEQRKSYKGIRRTIGEAMERSKFTAPHVTHHDEVDVTELVETRSRLKEEAEARGQKLSYMPFVVKAVVAALKEYPILNSQLDEEASEIVMKHYYNIGIATATDAGLMVPVVKEADQKGMLKISAEMNELVEKARDRSIQRSEMQGGTFSITNFGAIGGEYATPIINYPETAILGLGAIKEKPRVVNGEVVPRHVLTTSLSIDHRVIDGAEAAAFTNTVKHYLENPELLLLE